MIDLQAFEVLFNLVGEDTIGSSLAWVFLRVSSDIDLPTYLDSYGLDLGQGALYALFYILLKDFDLRSLLYGRLDLIGRHLVGQSAPNLTQFSLLFLDILLDGDYLAAYRLWLFLLGQV